MKQHQWILPEENRPSFQDYPEFHPLLLSILYKRGLRSSAEISSFLDKSLHGIHDPYLMHDMEKTVSRIMQALQKKEKILIYGDYDVDGISAITLLSQFFRYIQATHEYYIPHRIKEGYGLNMEGIQTARNNNVKLIITVDTGITGHEAIREASAYGIDVIVTDHHQSPENLPPAYAILNPNQPQCQYPYKYLSGVGVVFKLVHACLKQCGMDETESKRILKSLLDYVTLGTIADVVPLTGENRKLVASGLKQIKLSSFSGIRILFDQTFVEDKPLTPAMIAFKICPKLNASGRTDHANYSARLLLENDPRECLQLFSKLELFNRERKALEENDFTKAIQIIEQDKDHLDKRILVVAHPSFHPGVNGIVASRLTDKYHRPSIVMALNDNGFFKASARSIAGVNIFECLQSCEDLCIAFGGHPFAAGLTLDKSNLQEFTSRINAYMEKHFSTHVFEPRLQIDSFLSFSDITPLLMKGLQDMEPFGLGNPEPVFLTKHAVIQNQPRLLKNKHLKFDVQHAGVTLPVIGFNFSNKAPSLKMNDSIDFVYHLRTNSWLGQTHTQIELIDFKKN
ncbi:MAG: single-stranded-DNA-specific exonuclease RecJ [Candidatus Aureabacteria bacterium]|nr:single-stranded-DNA-specific exonuclease RecJ [Candidatus Auribacterota bacterium]